MSQSASIRGPYLAKHIHRLAESFARVRDHTPATQETVKFPIQYDDDYIHLEVDFPDHVDLQGDICFHGGRAVIRISR